MDSMMADTVVKVDEMTRKRDRIRNVMESAKACSGKNRAAEKLGAFDASLCSACRLSSLLAFVA
ncbi:hypothetical protein [Paraburkholderia dilworthii]|uniref:hypothetical protein n=1 Tax=Paraburkholderia dilworthii TaxID=948106 RepID=UPI0012691B58|nr:hypothetical protein [Paraburkholderia dilworthii]